MALARSPTGTPPALAGKSGGPVDTFIDIHQAVAHNDEERIKQFALSGGDLEARDKDSLTPLHIAAAGGLTGVVEYLIQKKAGVDAKSKIGHTALHLACRFGHVPIVVMLLSEGAEINSRDNDDNTPLHKAASNGKAQLCREMVKRGADIDARNKAEYTPLHWACFKGHKATAEQLVKCGANINATSSRGATPLFMSAFYGHVDVTFLLLAWGADSAINNEDNLKPGETFLLEVSETQRTQTKVLLSERMALLMKGYEAARRNMAMMYMRAERSDLNLRMSQGEVETLWGKLAKREKELNISKVGARDLSHAVKSMKVALERTRQDSRAARDKTEALEAEVEDSRNEAECQRNRAVHAEQALAQLREKLCLQKTGGVGTVSSGFVGEILSSSMGWRGKRNKQGKGQSSEEETPQASAGIHSSGVKTRFNAAAAAAARAAGAGTLDYSSDPNSSTSNAPAKHVPPSYVTRGTAAPKQSSLPPWGMSPAWSAIGSASFSGSSFSDQDGSSTFHPAMRASASGSSPASAATTPSSSSNLLLSLPSGRIAAIASAINTRVAKLGPSAGVPLPSSGASHTTTPTAASSNSALGAMKRSESVGSSSPYFSSSSCPAPPFPHSSASSHRLPAPPARLPKSSAAGLSGLSSSSEISSVVVEKRVLRGTGGSGGRGGSGGSGFSRLDNFTKQGKQVGGDEDDGLGSTDSGDTMPATPGTGTGFAGAAAVVGDSPSVCFENNGSRRNFE